MIQLYLNENIEIEIAMRLRNHGYNVLTTLEAGNAQYTDEKQLDYATRQERVILTHNRKHFKKLHLEWQSQDKLHRGIITTGQLREMTEFERRLLRLLNSFSREDIHNQIISLHFYK